MIALIIILLLIVFFLPKAERNPYAREDLIFMDGSRLCKVLKRRGWKVADKETAKKLLVRFGNTCFCAPDEKDVRWKKEYESESTPFLFFVIEELHQERVEQFESEKNIYPTAPLTKAFILLCASLSVIAIGSRHFMSDPSTERFVVLTSGFGFMTLVSMVAFNIFITRFQLHQKGYNWLTIRNTAKLLFCTGSKIRQLPNQSQVEASSHYRKYDVTSMIVMADRL